MPATSADPTTIAAWLTSLAAVFGISFGISKARTATIDRIEKAGVEGKEAKAEIARLEQKMLEQAIAAGEKFASIPHLSSVEKRVKEEIQAVEHRSKETMEAMEIRLVSAINLRRDNYHGD